MASNKQLYNNTYSYIDRKMFYYRNPRGFLTLYKEQPSLKRVSVTSHKIDVETDCGCYRVGHVVNIKQHVSKENCSYHPTTVKTMILIFYDGFEYLNGLMQLRNIFIFYKLN